MKWIFIFLLFLISSEIAAQTDSTYILSEIQAFQDTLNHEFRNKAESPLESKQLKKFKGHTFFPSNLNYYVTAKFVKENKDSVFAMATTTSRRPEYIKYGKAIFELDGKSYTLAIYQNLALREKEKYKDYLFLPFKDLTNGKESYPGGRFIDLKIPQGDSIIIDFNKAYNPYCAYNDKYSCPIPPRENHLEIEIPAGVKYNNKKK